MKAKDVLKLLGITRVTLSRYLKEGIILVDSTHKGKHIYNDESVYRFIGVKRKKIKKHNVVYSRVSNPPLKYLLEQEKRNFDFCTSKGIEILKSYKDIKSGMNFDRKEFNELLSEVVKGNIGSIVVENKDRLCRFGFDLFENFCKYFGTTIIIANDITEKSYEQELTDDLISIIHYFSMKSYSHRRKLNKIKRELENANLKNSN